MSGITLNDTGNNVDRFKRLLSNSTVVLMNKASLEYFGILSYGIEKYIYSKDSYKALFGAGSLGFTDGKTITYLVSDNATIADITFVTIHEILHIISYHVQRRDTRDPLLWNLAVDQVVNSILYDLSRESNMINWQDSCFLDPDLYNTHKHASAEDIYQLLLAKQSQYTIEKIMIDPNGQPKPQSGGSGSGDQQGQGSVGSGDSDDESDDSNQSQNGNQTSSGSGSQSGASHIPGQGQVGNYVIKVTDKKTGKTYYAMDDSNFVDKSTSKDVTDALDEIADQARITWNSGVITKGDMSSGLTEYLDGIFKVPIPWHKILENTILYTSQARQDVSWSWPNEVYRSINIHLPGPYKSELPDTLVAAFDVSGSITTEDLKTWIGVLCGACQHFDKLLVLTHDVDVHQEIDMGEDPNEDVVFEKLKALTGRGGTSHGPVFQRIAELEDTHQISCIMFLTDFYSDVEQCAPKHKWLENYETVWLLNSNLNVKLPEPCKFIEIHINDLK